MDAHIALFAQAASPQIDNLIAAVFLRAFFGCVFIALLGAFVLRAAIDLTKKIQATSTIVEKKYGDAFGTVIGPSFLYCLLSAGAMAYIAVTWSLKAVPASTSAFVQATALLLSSIALLPLVKARHGGSWSDCAICAVSYCVVWWVVGALIGFLMAATGQ